MPGPPELTYQDIKATHESNRLRVLEFLLAKGEIGATREEIAAGTGIPKLAVASYLFDLQGKDLRGLRRPEKLVVQFGEPPRFKLN
jgi:hypothetical protein